VEADIRVSMLPDARLVAGGTRSTTLTPCPRYICTDHYKTLPQQASPIRFGSIAVALALLMTMSLSA